jgi:predicted DNA-binding transcriptional regulator AlpA
MPRDRKISEDVRRTDQRVSLRRFISPAELRDLTGLSEPTLWRMRQRSELPDPIRLSPGRIAWPIDVIEKWLDARAEASR